MLKVVSYQDINVYGHWSLWTLHLNKKQFTYITFLTLFINIAKLQAGKGKAFNSALQKLELNLFI